MKRENVYTKWLFCLMAAFAMTISISWAAEQHMSFDDLLKLKQTTDDPSPIFKKLEGYKKVMSPNDYKKVTFDVEASKKAWAEVVGFKAPDVVGKVAPEIQPGKYTYKDKDKFPFDKIMFKRMHDKFNPVPTSGPRLVSNFTEMEIVPTRQYYQPLPTAEATLKNLGSAKLDDQGYLIPESYNTGYPFPRPEGKYKAQQIMCNWIKKYFGYEDILNIESTTGYSSNLKQDYYALGKSISLRLEGRTIVEPKGWYDQRAKEQKERFGWVYWNLAPRDVFGNVANLIFYSDPKEDLFLYYINNLRRVRKLSASDTQDPVYGVDLIWEDLWGFSQKLSPKRYPYKYEMVGEAEYLIPITWDGSPYLSTKEGFILRNLQFERRPIWIVQLTQQDKNYIYSKRTLYFDRETFNLYHVENYDQKGRLYRTYETVYAFIPEMGLWNQYIQLYLDHVDVHSTYDLALQYPLLGMTRADVSMSNMIKTK